MIDRQTIIASFSDSELLMWIALDGPVPARMMPRAESLLAAALLENRPELRQVLFEDEIPSRRVKAKAVERAA